MKKFLVGAVASVAMLGSVSVASAADYAAIAAGDGGFGWVSSGYGSMERARAAAKRACRNAGYGSCESSVAERSSWYYAGVVCDGRPYVGGSPRSVARAIQVAEGKGARDGNYNCYTDVTF